MGILNINDIEVGMEIVDDVVNFNGILLVKGGTVLNEKHLKAFKTWGITEANIKGVDQESLHEQALANVAPEAIAKVDRELAYVFQKTDLQDPVMAEIYRLTKKRRLQALIHE